MLSFSIYHTAFFMVRYRWGRDPTLQLYDDSFTELPNKSEFESANTVFFRGCCSILQHPQIYMIFPYRVAARSFMVFTAKSKAASGDSKAISPTTL